MKITVSKLDGQRVRVNIERYGESRFNMTLEDSSVDRLICAIDSVSKFEMDSVTTIQGEAIQGRNGWSVAFAVACGRMLG